MEEKKLQPFALRQIKSLMEGLSNSDRFISKDFAFVRSFGGVLDAIGKVFVPGQPYRLMEGRILYLRRGELLINYNLLEYRLKAPAVLVGSPGIVAEVKKWSGDCDFAILAFSDFFMDDYCRGGLLQAYYQHRLHLCLSIEEHDRMRMESLCRLLWEVLHDRPCSEEMVKDMVLLFFHQIDAYRQRYQQGVGEHASRQEEILTRFIDLVNTHAVENRKVSFYADKLCLSPHYLCALIRKASGLTVGEWVERAVVQEAKILLRYSNKPVASIADELNFASSSFFCKFFRRLTGMSPGAYRGK